MNLDKISDERLFLNNTKEEIIRWSNSLQYFHYMRARGGHNCEGDSFCVYLKYENKDDLLDKLSKIGINIKKLTEGDIAYNPFESYSVEDLDKLKVTISEYPDLIQPQDVTLFDQKVHIWVMKGFFEISVSGTKDGLVYKVTEDDFVVCKILENEFDKLNWLEILEHSIQYQIHCISKEIYPELFDMPQP